MPLHFRQLVLVLMLFLLLVGCVGAEPTLTATVVLPTAIAVPLTATPIPPTPATIPPTATSVPSSPTPTAQAEIPATKNYVPFFEPALCQLAEPSGFELECGYLVVPEDRSQPNGDQVRMHVAIFKSRSSKPQPDPLIYLTGGGGGNELDNTVRFVDDGNDAILNRRDFIMYNQRGTKYAQPYLHTDRFPFQS